MQNDQWIAEERLQKTMKLIECVEMLSTKTLKKILTTHYADRDFSKEEDRTLSFLLNREVLKKIWEDMSKDEQQVLFYFLLLPPSTAVFPKVMMETISIPYPFLLIALTLLRQKGFLYTHRAYVGDPKFFLPDDLRRALLEVLAQPSAEKLQPVEGRAPLPLLLRKMYALTEYVWKNPLSLTQKGLIHKRQVQQIEDELDLKHPSFPCDFAYEGEELYSPLLASILDFAAYRELLIQKGDRIVINMEKYRLFLEEKVEESVERFLTYLEERVYPLFPHLHRNVFDWLLLFPKGVWIPISFFFRFLNQNGYELKGLNEKEFEEEVLFPLQEWMGLLIRKRGEELEVALPRFESVEEERFYLQPNFQYMVSLEAPFHLRHRLARLAKMKTEDQMILYELTKDSIAFAVEQGLSVKEILEELHNLSYSVPENVRRTVEQWADLHGKLRFYDVLILVCESESLAEEIGKNPAFQPYLAGQLAPTVFAVRRKEMKVFRRKLSQAGYSPLEEVLKPGEAEEEMGYPLPLLFQVHHDWELRVENIFPEWNESLPFLSHFPRSWFTQYRSYHLTTLTDLLSKSIQYEIPVGFRVKGGEEFPFFIPLKMEKRENRLLIVGFVLDPQEEEKSVALEEIGEIQGLFPKDILNFVHHR
ncbi:hypothetical protein CULT_10171 [[Clostridium] ultunense Esp]|nr:hypothetical protein CULT_10171 [[Clostridium] ultunense Esp]